MGSVGERECGKRGRARVWEARESEREWESEREEWEGVREGESAGEWGERERESVGEQERMWERTENVGSDLDLSLIVFLVCLFDLILNVPSTIFQLNRDGSSWVEPVLR